MGKPHELFHAPQPQFWVKKKKKLLKNIVENNDIFYAQYTFPQSLNFVYNQDLLHYAYLLACTHNNKQWCSKHKDY
jgi:hypothetical protein